MQPCPLVSHDYLHLLDVELILELKLLLIIGEALDLEVPLLKGLLQRGTVEGELGVLGLEALIVVGLVGFWTGRGRGGVLGVQQHVHGLGLQLDHMDVGLRARRGKGL